MATIKSAIRFTFGMMQTQNDSDSQGKIQSTDAAKNQVKCNFGDNYYGDQICTTKGRT